MTICCPNCRRMPEVTTPAVVKSGVVLTCPKCGGQIRIDLVRFVEAPKPVQMRRPIAA